jgi:hypothetical protein
VVERALSRSGWKADYTRRLRADGLRFSDEVLGYGPLVGHFLYMDIHNGRPDIAALEATAKLAKYGPNGRTMQPSLIRSPLKTTGRPGYSHTVFPKSHEAFDLLCVGESRSTGPEWPVPAATGSISGPPLAFRNPGVYLNSAYDVVGAGRLPITPGVWMLRYDFYAIDFPLLSVTIELDVADWNNPKATIVSQDIA